MNNKNSIIEYYRRMVCEPINTYTFKQKGKDRVAMDTWEKCMRTHIGYTEKMSSREHAEKIFELGEHLRDVFFSTKDESEESTTSETQSMKSSGGRLWERLVAYYLNYCLANTRTVVFTGVPKFEAIRTAVTFNDMDSASEVDLLAVTFPEKPEFQDDIFDIRVFNQADGMSIPIEIINNTRISEKTRMNRLADYYINMSYPEIGIHVIQCKTNWNDDIQTPMLWGLLYDLSRSGVRLPVSSSIAFGSGKYTLPRLDDFSYSFVALPSQNNGEYETDLEKRKRLSISFEQKFSEENLPVKRAKFIKGGYYWGLPKHNTIHPVGELLNRNLATGLKGHIVENIESNIVSGCYKTDFSYFVEL